MSLRLLKAFLVATLLFVGLVGAEILIALRREYLVEGPAERIEGVFGIEGKPRVRLVVLGDSTAVGVGTTPDNAYPVVLSEALSDELQIDLTVLGRSGDRVEHLRTEQLPEAIEMKPDLVVICVGANDATHVTRPGSVRASIAAILDELADGGIDTVVVGPPDMGAKAFAEPLRTLSRTSGSRVSKIIRSEAVERGFDFVPLADLTGPLFAEDPELYFSKDDFHPSAEGYRLWVDAMLPVVARAARRAAHAG